MNETLDAQAAARAEQLGKLFQQWDAQVKRGQHKDAVRTIEQIAYLAPDLFRALGIPPPGDEIH